MYRKPVETCLLATGLVLGAPAAALAHDPTPLLHKLLLPLLILVALVTLWLKHLLLARREFRRGPESTVRLVILTLADVVIWTGLVPTALMLDRGGQTFPRGTWALALLVAYLASQLMHWLVLRRCLTLRRRPLWFGLTQLVLIYPFLVACVAGLLIRLI